MADLLTVYDDEEVNNFIDCKICGKRIRGDTQFKIHVTTLAHLKKEDSLVQLGKIPRQPQLPNWTNIVDYLKHLNLDEPIIGLSSLIQLPDQVMEDGTALIRYKCRMCFVEMELHSIVAHIIGRKHRQKYLELKRPDLVTWQDSTQKQLGLVAKAKAALVEKQDGWGTPTALRKPQGKPQYAQTARNTVQSSFQERPNYSKDSHRPARLNEKVSRTTFSKEDQRRRPLHSDNEKARYNRPHPGAAAHQLSAPGGNRISRPVKKTFGEPEPAGVYRRSAADHDAVMERQLRRGYEEETPQMRVSSQEQERGFYNETPKPRNLFHDKDLRSYPPAQLEYQKEPMETERYPAYDERVPIEDRRRDFHDEDRWSKTNFDPRRFESRDISELYSQDPVPAKRKKKSRFTDATMEEMAVVQTRHLDKTGREEHRDVAYRANSSVFRDSAVDTGNNLQVGQNSENVLDMFNDIQIENIDEARFLKEKLCSVLKEFQASKKARTGDDYRDGSPMELHRDSYSNDSNRRNRNVSEMRRIEDDPRGFQDSRRYRENSERVETSRSFENNPRLFQDDRQYKDSSRNVDETRYFKDDTRQSSTMKFAFDSHPRETRLYNDKPREFQDGRQGFSDRRGFEGDFPAHPERSTEYLRVPEKRNPVDLRSRDESRYYDDDFRSFRDGDDERKWDRPRSSHDRYEERGHAEAERQFPEKYSKPYNNYREDARMFPGSVQQWSHQDGQRAGEDPYDPFQPSKSPSPPQETPSATSLDKIASTLLELVARSQNK